MTDSGSIELLPGYIVDVWITGSDEAGNPYLAENNTEHTPLVQWRLIRIGPDIDLRGNSTVISWNNPSPIGGEDASLSIQGTNNNDQAGEITFILLEEITADQWVEVSDVETIVNIDSMTNWSATLVLPTTEVEESEIHRYQLVARDRHIDIAKSDKLDVVVFISTKIPTKSDAVLCTSLLIELKPNAPRVDP